MSTEADGRVVELLPQAIFRVELDSRAQVLAHLAAATKLNAMRIRMGDRVHVAISPHDHGRGRITKVLRKI